MSSLSRTGKSCKIFAAVTLLFLLLSVKILLAGPCPYLPENLQQKITGSYPGYTVRDYRSLDNEHLQDIVRKASESCYHLVKLSPTSFAISLVHDTTGKIKIITAESLLYGNMTGWFTYDVDSFDREIPLLEPAKAGMYVDVDDKKYFVLTRNCQAFKVKLLPSRREYIYEFLGKGEVKKYRIK